MQVYSTVYSQEVKYYKLEKPIFVQENDFYFELIKTGPILSHTLLSEHEKNAKCDVVKKVSFLY